MDDQYGSIEREEGDTRLIPGLCPLSVRLYKVSDRRWIVAWHHRHGFNEDPVPFGVVDQIFN